AREIAGVSCRCIDIEPPQPGSWQEALLTERLPLELGADGGDGPIAYRGAGRFERHFVPVPLPGGQAPRLRERGTYVITGGLGGIGLPLAEHLGRRLRARLVLLGRAPLPGRPEWEAWIAGRGPEDLTAER